jgi:5'-nucleotidase
MLEYRKNNTTPETAPSFAITNAGGIRASMDVGNITRGEVLQVFPFGNAVVESVLTGDRLWRTIEGVLSDVNQNSGAKIPTFVQVSKGISIEYDPAAASGSKLVAVAIEGQPLEKQKEYRFVTVDFLATGGDNVFSPVLDNSPALDALDEVLVDYLGTRSPIEAKIEGRIKEVSNCYH